MTYVGKDFRGFETIHLYQNQSYHLLSACHARHLIFTTLYSRCCWGSKMQTHSPEPSHVGVL